MGRLPSGVSMHRHLSLALVKFSSVIMAVRRKRGFGVPRSVKSICVAFVRSFWDGAMAYGRTMFAVQEVADAEPGEAHPERVRPDLPLSRTEKALERQMRDLR